MCMELLAWLKPSWWLTLYMYLTLWFPALSYSVVVAASSAIEGWLNRCSSTHGQLQVIILNTRLWAQLHKNLMSEREKNTYPAWWFSSSTLYLGGMGMSPASGCSWKATSCFVDTHLPRSHWSSSLCSLSPWQHSHMCTAKSNLNGWERGTHTLPPGRVTLPISAVFCVPIAMGGKKMSSQLCRVTIII